MTAAKPVPLENRIRLPACGIVNIALPSIRQDLHFSVQGRQWVISGYLITYGGFVLLGGRAGDLLGRRRVLVAGTSLFGISSLAGGFAGSAGVLVGARLAQGVSAAMMMPAALSILTIMFKEGADRAKALGIWATGGVGRQLLEQAVAAGHDVTAVARNPKKLSRDVQVVTADMAAPDPAALQVAVQGADAVLSGLGPHSTSDAGIASQGTRAIVAAMQTAGVRRIVAVSAAPVGTVPSPGRPDPPRHDPGDGSSCEPGRRQPTARARREAHLATCRDR